MKNVSEVKVEKYASQTCLTCECRNPNAGLTVSIHKDYIEVSISNPSLQHCINMDGAPQGMSACKYALSFQKVAINRSAFKELLEKLSSSEREDDL